MPFFLLAAFGLTALDFVAKRLADIFLAGQKITLIPGILELLRDTNKGGAYGILSGHPWVLILIGVVVLLGALWYIKKERSRSRWQYNGLIFIFAGTLGNLIDRIFYGEVIDFINLPFLLPYLPTFNLADIFIDIGAACLIVYLICSPGREN